MDWIYSLYNSPNAMAIKYLNKISLNKKIFLLAQKFLVLFYLPLLVSLITKGVKNEISTNSNNIST